MLNNFSHDEINLESYYDETAEYYLKHILKFNIKNMGYSENVEQAFMRLVYQIHI